MRLTHLGHSALLVQAVGQRVLIDPGTLSDFEHLDRLDAVLITHHHPDHLDVDRLIPVLQRSPGVGVWGAPQAVDTLNAALAEAAADATGEVEVAAADAPIAIGDLIVEPVGEWHAEIHPYLERIGNRGFLIRAPGEPTLFHPGDALDAEPGVAIALLCVPVNAPWGKVAEAIAFVRRIAPERIIPIHDGLLTPSGRAIYLGHLGGYGADGGVEVLDLREAGATEIGG